MTHDPGNLDQTLQALRKAAHEVFAMRPDCRESAQTAWEFICLEYYDTGRDWPEMDPEFMPESFRDEYERLRMEPPMEGATKP